MGSERAATNSANTGKRSMKVVYTCSSIEVALQRNCHFHGEKLIIGATLSSCRTLRELRVTVLSRGVAFDLPANYGSARSFTLFRSAASLGATVGFEEGSNIRMAVFGGRF